MNDYTLSVRRFEALDAIDRMPHHLRECVHEFGLPIVTVLTKHGVKDPRHIREIVTSIWHGARQEGQRTGAMNTLDVILAREPLSSKALLRLLANSSMTIVPMFPTRVMLDASMAEVSNHDFRCTREEKHRLRLIAAIRAASEQSIGLSKAVLHGPKAGEAQT